MINQTSDIRGNFEKGELCCDNQSCRKVLYEWFDEYQAPNENRASCFAYSVKTRMIFNRFATDVVVSAFSPSFIFFVNDKYIGYIIDFDVLPLRLDFCSTECCLVWLNDDTNYGRGRDFAPLPDKRYYGVMVYGENPQKQDQLVADNESRFRTIKIGNFMPTSASKNRYEFSKGQQVNITGHVYDIRIGNVLDSDGRQIIGVAMTTLMFKCPMLIMASFPFQVCDQLIHVIVDFIPSAWICPKCNGLIVFDDINNMQKHPNAKMQSNLRWGDSAISANYYPGKVDWGDENFVKWITDETGIKVIAVADAYQDMYPNGHVSRSLIDLNDVVNLFGHLIHEKRT